MALGNTINNTLFSTWIICHKLKCKHHPRAKQQADLIAKQKQRMVEDPHVFHIKQAHLISTNLSSLYFFSGQSRVKIGNIFTLGCWISKSRLNKREMYFEDKVLELLYSVYSNGSGGSGSSSTSPNSLLISTGLTISSSSSASRMVTNTFYIFTSPPKLFYWA